MLLTEINKLAEDKIDDDRLQLIRFEMSFNFGEDYVHAEDYTKYYDLVDKELTRIVQEEFEGIADYNDDSAENEGMKMNSSSTGATYTIRSEWDQSIAGVASNNIGRRVERGVQDTLDFEFDDAPVIEDFKFNDTHRS